MRPTNLFLSAVALLLALGQPAATRAASFDAPPGRSHDEFARPDRDLVAWWTFEDSPSDRIHNWAGGGLGGVCHGARAADDAFEFDGENDYVDIPHFRKLSALSTGTISVWFRFDSVRTGMTVQPIFYFGDPDGGADNTCLVLEIGHFWPDRKTRALYFTIFGIPGQKPTFCFDTMVDLEMGVWHHFVAVVGTGFNTGYLNGMELTGRNYNFGGPTDTVFFDDVPNPGTCTIGRAYFANYSNLSHFDGAIGDIRIYRRPLTGAEVSALHQELRHGGEAHGSRPAARTASERAAGRDGMTLDLRPNPFNPTTRIRFGVTERTHVTLQIFTAAGRRVVTLLDEEVAPGSREVEWNGTDSAGRAASSGVYFCRVEGAGRVLTQKMVLGK